MAEKELTDKQKLFLELLFTEEYQDNPRQAAIVAGYSPNTDIYQIMHGLKEEIFKRVDEYLVLHAPKCVNGIISVINNPHQAGAKTKLEAAGTVLDRIGLTKKDRVEVEVKAPNSVLILPTKKEV